MSAAMGRLLARANAAAERNMVDTCSIRRATGTVTDPDSGVITPTWAPVYFGRCRVQQIGNRAGLPQDAGQASLLIERLQLQLPLSVTGLAIDDEVTMTAAMFDQDLIGRVWLIRSLAHKTNASARRVQVSERGSS